MPKSLSGCGTPIDWCAESSADEVAVEAAQQLHHLLVLDVGEAEAAVLLGDLHAEGAQPAQAVEHVLRVLAGGVDLDRVDLVAQEGLELAVEGGELGAVRARAAG